MFKTHQGNTRHNQIRDERSPDATLRAILETGPTEDIEVASTKQVSRIEVAGVGVDEIVVQHHLVPLTDEVLGYVVRDLQITVHAQVAGEGAICRVVEGNAVQAIDARVTKEVRRVCRLRLSRNGEVDGALSRGTTTAATWDVRQELAKITQFHILVKGAEIVATSDFTANVEVLLAQRGSACTSSFSPSRERVDGDLRRLVDTDGIDVEGSDRHARERRKLSHDVGFPLAETVLDGCELGQLTLPIGVDTERLHVSVLIEFGRSATASPARVILSAIVLPEGWQNARGVNRIIDLNVP